MTFDNYLLSIKSIHMELYTVVGLLVPRCTIRVSLKHFIGSYQRYSGSACSQTTIWQAESHSTLHPLILKRGSLYDHPWESGKNAHSPISWYLFRGSHRYVEDVMTLSIIFATHKYSTVKQKIPQCDTKHSLSLMEN